MNDPLQPKPSDDLPQQSVADGMSPGEAAFAQALRRMEPPADLEARLIAAMHAARQQVTPNPSLLKKPQPRRQWLRWAAGIAAVGIGGGMVWMRHRQLSMAKLSAELAHIARDGFMLEFNSENSQAIFAWLREKHAPVATLTPPKIDALPRFGCDVHSVSGHRVSLQCFKGPGSQVLHLFGARNSDLIDPPSATEPVKFFTLDEFTMAAWSHDERTMLVVTRASADEVRALLSA